jgi:hypothetical protein
MNQAEYLNQKQIIPWQNLSQLKPKKNMKGRMKHKTERKAKKTKKTFQLNNTEQQLTACKAEVIRLQQSPFESCDGFFLFCYHGFQPDHFGFACCQLLFSVIKLECFLC